MAFVHIIRNFDQSKRKSCSSGRPHPFLLLGIRLWIRTEPGWRLRSNDVRRRSLVLILYHWYETQHLHRLPWSANAPAIPGGRLLVHNFFLRFPSNSREVVPSSHPPRTRREFSLPDRLIAAKEVPHGSHFPPVDETALEHRRIRRARNRATHFRDFRRHRISWEEHSQPLRSPRHHRFSLRRKRRHRRSPLALLPRQSAGVP